MVLLLYMVTFLKWLSRAWIKSFLICLGIVVLAGVLFLGYSFLGWFIVVALLIGGYMLLTSK